jgi:hypothetical protein
LPNEAASKETLGRASFRCVAVVDLASPQRIGRETFDYDHQSPDALLHDYVKRGGVRMLIASYRVEDLGEKALVAPCAENSLHETRQFMCRSE